MNEAAKKKGIPTSEHRHSLSIFIIPKPMPGSDVLPGLSPFKEKWKE